MPQIATIYSWTAGYIPGKGGWAGFISSSPGEVFSDGLNVASAGCYVHSYNGHYGILWPYPRKVFINGQPISCVGDGFSGGSGYWGNIIATAGSQTLTCTP